MAEKMGKEEVVEKEQIAWRDVSRRMEFLAGMVCAKTDRTMVQDAANAMNIAVREYVPLHKQRMLLEFGE